MIKKTDEAKPKVLCPLCETLLNKKFYCTKCKRDFSEEVDRSLNDETITDVQIAAQDRIDNACFDLIKEFAPDSGWDIEQISIIRDALIGVLTRFHGEKEFDIYPWILETVDSEKQAETPERTIESEEGITLRVKTKLKEKVVDADPINVEVLFRNGGD